MGGAKNCPETPRQKMIGMMYLVLTAMLALNVSTDILNGFTLVDNSLHSSIAATDTRNAKLYQDFQAANADNPEKTQEWFDKAKEVQHRADSLYNYIQDFKEHIALLADGKKRVDELRAQGLDPTMHIEGNSNLDVTGQYAIVQGNGLILKEIVAYYRDYAAGLAESDAELRNAIQQALATERGYNAHEKDSCDWEVAVFDGMPVGASITILTKMQNDVRTTEGQLIQYLMDRTDAGDLRVNKLNAYVIPNSNYVIRGGKYSAQIILAAIDSTQRPEYYIEGQRINDHGLYEVAASGVGLKKYSGWIAYQNPSTGEMENLPFSSEYSVGEPAVTISNNDLNIMYRGYENKFSISVPGVSNDKVKVNVSGASVHQSGGVWVIKPGEGSKKVTISVNAELDGKMQPMGSKEYRVKALPDPQAYFSARDKEYTSGNIAPSTLTHSSGVVTASYGPEGLLDLPFKVTSFRAIINGMTTQSNGNKFTKDQLAQIGKLKKGGMVVLQDIRAVGPGGQEKRLAPLVLTLN
ncbi:MAG: gliding motility protein GldM [Paludibacteraceae bacterium]|nr:gliding motility protein GldM [Paludibacteraceae bacterium]MBQ6763603.1 gliding motility protein GldM [Paludibacteraceae bacterium]